MSRKIVVLTADENQLNPAQKQEAADLVSEIADDVSQPAEQRKSRAVMNAVMSGLEHVLANAASLATLWTAIAPHLPVR